MYISVSSVVLCKAFNWGEISNTFLFKQSWMKFFLGSLTDDFISSVYICLLVKLLFWKVCWEMSHYLPVKCSFLIIVWVCCETCYTGLSVFSFICSMCRIDADSTLYMATSVLTLQKTTTYISAHSFIIKSWSFESFAVYLCWNSDAVLSGLSFTSKSLLYYLHFF